MISMTQGEGESISKPTKESKKPWMRKQIASSTEVLNTTHKSANTHKGTENIGGRPRKSKGIASLMSSTCKFQSLKIHCQHTLGLLTDIVYQFHSPKGNDLYRKSKEKSTSGFRKKKVELKDNRMPLIVWGDGMNNNQSYHGHMYPVSNKIYKNLLQRQKYNQVLVLTVDEYLTSQVSYAYAPFASAGHTVIETLKLTQTCNNCKHRQLEKWKDNDGNERHGISDCKNCAILWSRDINVAKNLLAIAMSIWSGQGRPDPCKRSQKETNIPRAKVG